MRITNEPWIIPQLRSHMDRLWQRKYGENLALHQWRRMQPGSIRHFFCAFLSHSFFANHQSHTKSAVSPSIFLEKTADQSIETWIQPTAYGRERHDVLLRRFFFRQLCQELHIWINPRERERDRETERKRKERKREREKERKREREKERKREREKERKREIETHTDRQAHTHT